jgi:hypothetical protein
MKFIACLVFVFHLSNITYCQTRPNVKDSMSRCSNVIEEISYYWKLDSLANNGFRECAYKKVLKSKLDKISKSFLLEKLGKPNEISENFNGDTAFIYYYFDIKAMPKTYEAPLAVWYISFFFKKNEDCASWVTEGDGDR